MNGWAADYLDPRTFLGDLLHLTVPWWRNADYEHLLDVARHLADPTERIRVYQTAERILAQEAPIIPLTYPCDPG